MLRNIIEKLYFYTIYIINYVLLFFYKIYEFLPEMPIIPITSLYLIISFLIVIIFCYRKIKYPFWNVQPVFHTYDFWRYYRTVPFYIQNDKPMKTKFLDFHNIIVLPYFEYKSGEIDEIINLLQCYYISSENVLFTINKKVIETYMTGNDGTSYLSIYYDINIINNIKIKPIG